MKCDYCLEEIKDGAAACPHCTREQLWSVEQRVAKAADLARQEKEANFGCVMKVILGIAGLLLAMVVLGNLSRVSDRHEREQKESQQQAAAACATFVAAGDFKTEAECSAKVGTVQIVAYSAALLSYCQAKAAGATQVSADCYAHHSPNSKKCREMDAEAARAMNWAACMIAERIADKTAGLTIEAGSQAEKYVLANTNH